MKKLFPPTSRVESPIGNTGTVLEPPEGRKDYRLIKFDNGAVLWVDVRNLQQSDTPEPARVSKRSKKQWKG